MNKTGLLPSLPSLWGHLLPAERDRVMRNSEKKAEVLKNVTAVQLEDARSVAKANSEFNAQMYKTLIRDFADFSSSS